jgi:hypothetical protein
MGIKCITINKVSIGILLVKKVTLTMFEMMPVVIIKQKAVSCLTKQLSVLLIYFVKQKNKIRYLLNSQIKKKAVFLNV